jgi:hypothetical protein
MDEDDPEYLLYRRKTCPCCRAVIRTRPIPVFIVKTIATALAKSNGQKRGAAQATPSPTDEDPWDGLFLPYEEEFFDEGDESENEEFNDEEDGSDWEMNAWYGSDSEDERYYGEYVHPIWEPPITAPSMIAVPNQSPTVTKLLRRGATLDMVNLYHMNYSHTEGMSATINDIHGNRGVVYLGWGLDLNPEDFNGKEFMDWILGDIDERPERWSVSHSAEGWTARKLVPSNTLDEYDTTESEAWYHTDEND